MASSMHHSRSWAKAGSQAVHSGCSKPMDGVVRDWCAPPSGARVTPDGVPTRMDWPPAYMPKDHGSRARATKRVVDGGDRTQRLAPAAPGRSEFGDEAHEVGFGDAEFDVLAVGVFNPAEDPFEVVREPVLAFTDGPDSGFVDPAAEVGGGGNVGAAGDDTVGHLGRCPFQVGQEPSQRGLRGNPVAVAPWQGIRDQEGRGQRGLPALEPEGCPGAGPFFDGARLEFAPWIVKVHP